MTARVPTALLISGGGRTALNLIQHAAAGTLPIDVVCAIATRPDCAGVTRLRDVGIEVEVVARDMTTPTGLAPSSPPGAPSGAPPSPPPGALHDRTDEILRAAGVELVCLCGWLRHFRVVDPDSGTDWTKRTLNIHPALLPAFGGQGMHGMNVHRAVLASGATESGCTVHFVDAVYDHGPTILQRRVPVLPDDTPETLAARVFEQELIAYPEAILRVVGDGSAARQSHFPP